MTNAQIQQVAIRKGKILKNGQGLRVTELAEIGYWVSRMSNGDLYIGYMANEKMPKFYSNKKEYVMRNQSTGNIVSYWQKLNPNMVW